MISRAFIPLGFADTTGVTLGNADGEIAGLTISDSPTQAEVQALRDACEELADDVRALSALACQGGLSRHSPELIEGRRRKLA